jgi:hypothetical protein
MNSSELNDVIVRWKAVGSDVRVIFSVPGCKFSGLASSVFVTKNECDECRVLMGDDSKFTFSLSACEIKYSTLDDAPEWLTLESLYGSRLLITSPSGFTVALVELKARLQRPPESGASR